ncbi:flagellin [Noviherbaspirillum saxi]|uniref:Flagellin n=1 Tax=Noviherbaspirillum saxi TaxID=2320863 RepID=A0A3A3FSW9_9BURK|nr:flagellin [Noviherbaspirillum saxi]RJF98610.1 flagellin [Noviherbaspirillum saxi]
MSSMINTNIASLNAQRNLSSSSSSLTTALQRLSSGLRINSAKDDAAGLAISQRMSSQIGGLSQAARNANDAISLAQTAEGALSGMSDNLQRLRTLAVQSANATNSDSDRATIQTEVASLVAEIGRVAQTTEFNGIKLLDGSFTSQAFQVGANANQTISISMDNASTSKLGSTQASSLTASNNGTALASADLTINGVAIGASVAASDNASTAGASSSAISKAAAINAASAQTGVTAKADVNTVAGASMTGTAGTGTITINGKTSGTITLGTDTAANRTAVISAINAMSGQTGVVATDTGADGSGISLAAADGRNVAVSFSSASGTFTSATTGVTSGTGYGTYTLSSTKAITVSGAASKLANAGVTAGTYATQTAYASTTANTTTAAFASGDIKLNGVIIGASLAASDKSSTTDQAKSAISKAAAINAVSSQTGVTATANATTVSGAAMTGAAGTGTFTINGVTTDLVTVTTDAQASRTAVINAINAKSGQTGVVAVDGGADSSGVTLIAQDGRNVALTASQSSGSFASATTGVTLTATTYGTFTLNSAKSFKVEAGSTASMSSLGMLNAGTYGAGKSGQALSTIDVSTASGANDAITAIDNAISTINTSRANLGAIQNRFTSTISTLQSTSENLTAAKSRITDADFAAETANMTRGQILQQAGTAMLAQANGLPNGVLALLR